MCINTQAAMPQQASFKAQSALAMVFVSACALAALSATNTAHSTSQPASVSGAQVKKTKKTTAAAKAPTRLSPVATGGGPVLRDAIAAMVGSQPIMLSESAERFKQMQTQDNSLVHNAENQKRALDSLVDEKLILLAAQQAGEKVSDTELNQLLKQQAQSQGLSEEQYQTQVLASGQSWDAFRQRARDQILVTRYTQAAMRARVKVSAEDVDAAVQAQQQAITVTTVPAINLGHILVLLPKDKGDKNAMQAREQRIEAAWQRLQQGADFAQVAQEVSEALEGKRGGEIGLLPEHEYPKEFLAAVAAMPLGAVSRIVRSNVGFHILKVLDRQRLLPTQNITEAIPGTVPQVHVRHILIAAADNKSTQEALRKMADIRTQIVSKKLDFAQAAQQYSQDSSAQNGGELPWAEPGVFAPEFERAIVDLKPGELSKPVLSRFGVHLIQFLESRRRLLTDAELHTLTERRMQAQRSAQAYKEWTAELRKQQFVEYRFAPLQ